MNGYEKNFIKWFKRDGWMIRGTDVWCADCDDRCPFKLTYPMVERLAKEGILQRIYPHSAPIWVDCYQLTEKFDNMSWGEFDEKVYGGIKHEFV